MGKGSPCKRFREGVGRAGRFTVDSGKLRDAQGCSGSSSGPREPREPAESKRATVRSTEPRPGLLQNRSLPPDFFADETMRSLVSEFWMKTA